MHTQKQKDITEDKSSWAVGGGIILGVGVGFFLFHISVFFFVGSILAGMGLGLILAAVLSLRNRK